MKDNSILVGMDVHKNSIDIAIAQKGRQGQLRHFGTIEGSLAAVDKVVRKLVSNGQRPCFAYEAGPCGYSIYRHLTAKGFDCAVVARWLVPRANGNRIKNDRRDCLMLARLHRAGELTAVCVPHDDDEALRDLTRAREDAKVRKKAKQRLLAFLLRSGHHYSGRASWSQAHMRWLADLKMPHHCQQIVLQEYIEALESLRPAAAAADRSDPAAGAAVAAVSGGTGSSEPARRLPHRCGHHSGRDRRFQAFSKSPAADELPGPGALGAFQRREDPARFDHQGRQHTCAPHAGRSRLGLSVQGPGHAKRCSNARRACRNPFAMWPGKSGTIVCLITT